MISDRKANVRGRNDSYVVSVGSVFYVVTLDVLLTGGTRRKIAAEMMGSLTTGLLIVR